MDDVNDVDDVGMCVIRERMEYREEGSNDIVFINGSI